MRCDGSRGGSPGDSLIETLGRFLGVTTMAGTMTEAKNRSVRSQTLERGLDALQSLADGTPRTSQELADELGLHR